jgi:hypothetical protein
MWDYFELPFCEDFNKNELFLMLLLYCQNMNLIYTSLKGYSISAISVSSV